MKDEIEKDLKPVKSLQEAGQEFYAELLQRFGCDRSEFNPVLEHETTAIPSKAKPLDTVGERFIADVLRRFHHDPSFHEVDQQGQAA